MKTGILYLVLLILAFSKPLISQNKSLGLGPIITSVVIVDDTCKGASIKLKVESSTACTYKWSNGNISSTFSTSTAGFYYVTVTDKNANSIIGGPYEIKDYPRAPLLVNPDVVGDCNNKSNGYIHFNLKNTDIYNWSHDPNLHSSNADNLSPGTYTLTVTDKTGVCKFTGFSWELHDNTPKIKYLKIGGISPCVSYKDTSGYIEILIDMYYPYFPASLYSSPPYASSYAKGSIFTWDLKDFIWYFGKEIGYILTGLPKSGYTKFTFYGNDNCSIDTILYIPKLADLKSNILTSFPDKETHLYTANTQVKGGQAPYTYKWSDGNNQQSRNDLLAGKSYHVTVTDIYGCSSSNNVYVKKLKGENEVNFVNKGDNIEIRTDSGETSENRYTYKLFDVFGKPYIIKETDKNESQWQMNTTNLANGMYYLTAQYDDVIQTFPFVIMR